MNPIPRRYLFHHPAPAPYIIAAYALLWVALLVYVLMVFRDEKATAQLTLLEEAVADQQAKARAAKDE